MSDTGKQKWRFEQHLKRSWTENKSPLLVPTTILAQQHYETIQERFQDYPD